MASSPPSPTIASLPSVPTRTSVTSDPTRVAGRTRSTPPRPSFRALSRSPTPSPDSRRTRQPPSFGRTSSDRERRAALGAGVTGSVPCAHAESKLAGDARRHSPALRVDARDLSRAELDSLRCDQSASTKHRDLLPRPLALVEHRVAELRDGRPCTPVLASAFTRGGVRSRGGTARGTRIS